MKFKDIEPLLWGAINIYGTSKGNPLLYEGYCAGIPEELFEYEVIEISSNHDWINGDDLQTYVEITIKNN